MTSKPNYKGYYNRKSYNNINLNSYLSALPSDNKIIKRNDYSYLTNCVTHEDRNPSLCISQGDNRVVFKCYAGCSQTDLGDYFRSKLGGL